MRPFYNIKSCALAIVAISLFFPVSASGETLGRFFLTPADIARLEKLRQNPLSEKSDTDSYSTAPIMSGPSLFTLNGMVIRNDGAHTIWLNGAPYTSPALPATVKLSRPYKGEIEIVAPGSGKVYPLRPGQTIDAISGRILDTYEPASPSTPASQIFKRHGP